MLEAEFPHSAAMHRHQWLRDGRVMDVCAGCPAARPRSRVTQAFSMLAIGLGVLALVGMIARISLGDRQLALMACPSSPAHHYSSIGAGC